MQHKSYSRDQVIKAFESTKSAMAAARYLGCSYRHFKAFARKYRTDDGKLTLLEVYKNQAGKDISKNARKSYGDNMVKTIDILNGNVSFAHFTYDQLKNRLIRDKYIPCKCSECGFDKHRRDGSRPLILIFKDENIKNFKKENLDLVCYNCYFMSGKKLVVNQEYVPGLNTFNPENDQGQLIDHTGIITDYMLPSKPKNYDPSNDLYEFVKR